MALLFLSSLRQQKIELIKKGDGLIIRGEQSNITAELKATLKARKSEILSCFERLGLQSSAQIALSSFNQRRLWLVDHMQGQSPEYILSNKIDVREPITDALVQRIYDQLLQRYEVLRVGFEQEDGEVFQLVRAYQSQPICTRDISHLSPLEQESAVHKMLQEDSTLNFNLTHDTLLRITSIKLSETHRSIIYSLHHTVADGWSLSLIRNEFNAMFARAQSGDDDLLTGLSTPVSFIDYSEWERRTLTGSKNDVLLNYWTTQLDNIPSVHSLPLDFERPAQRSSQGKVFYQSIPAAAVAPLQDLCKTHGTTIFAGFFGVFSLLLHRLSQSNDIVVGTPVLNRDTPELRNIVGYIANTVVLRQRFERLETVADLLQASKDVVINALKHQQVPFDALSQALGLAKSSQHDAIYQLFFSMKVALESDNGSWNEAYTQNDQFAACPVISDLVVQGEEFQEGWVFEWMFNESLFSPDTIITFSEIFEHLIHGLIAQPNAKLADIGTLTKAQIATHVTQETANSAAVDGQTLNAILSKRFEGFSSRSHVENNHLQAQQIALQTSSLNYSYAELDETCAAMASYFAEQGVQAGDIVGVYGQQTAHLCFTILALWRIGAAYLPLSTELPNARLAYMCEEANVAHIAVIDLPEYEAEKQSIFASELTLHVVNADKCNTWKTTYPEQEWYVAKADDIAVVLCTSGSTGKPKGVKLTQGNLAAYLQGANAHYHIQPSDNVLQFSIATFDIFIEELLCALVQGATLVMGDRQTLLVPEQFWAFIKAQQVTVVSLPTAFWHALIVAIPDTSTDLRLVIVGGEKMQANLLHSWQQYMSSAVQVLNTYGPTETTVITTVEDVTEYVTGEQEISLGRSIGSSQVYILQHDNQLAAPNVYGRIAMTGPCVAAGYLNTEQDAGAFIPNTLDNTSTNMFVTADIAKKTPDGRIHFKGRVGNQVKIRGHRIELDEIQCQFNGTEWVSQSVISVEGEQLSQSLCAFVTLTDAAQSQPPAEIFAQLQGAIRQFLPHYMVPSKIVFVSELPLTVNGKVDATLLADKQHFVGDSSYQAPEGDVEQQLVALWSSLLNIPSEQLSVYADFFAVGGHSLLLVQLHRDVETTFAVTMSFSELFEKPNIRHMGQRILLAQLAGQDAPLLSGNDKELEELSW